LNKKARFDTAGKQVDSTFGEFIGGQSADHATVAVHPGFRDAALPHSTHAAHAMMAAERKRHKASGHSGTRRRGFPSYGRMHNGWHHRSDTFESRSAFTSPLPELPGSIADLATTLCCQSNTASVKLLGANGQTDTRVGAAGEEAFQLSHGAADPWQGGRYIWIRQRLTPEKTFPKGIQHVLMGSVITSGKADLQTVEGKMSPGTPHNVAWILAAAGAVVTITIRPGAGMGNSPPVCTNAWQAPVTPAGCEDALVRERTFGILTKQWT
jgi:hypothetical protein